MIIKLNNQNLQHTISTYPTVLVKFGAHWCAPCKEQDKILKELAVSIPSVVFGEVDYDEDTSLAQTYQISSLPTLILFRNDTERVRLIGLQTRQTIQNIVKM